MTANADQFRIIAELARELGRERMRFWLRGGWALDFLLGEVTRPHADIDLLSWRRHRDRIGHLLRARDFALVPTEAPEAELRFSKSEQDVHIILVERAPDGRLVTRGFESWPWPQGALQGPRRTLLGVTCLVLAPDALLEEKVAYERHLQRPPRPKDLISIEHLRALGARCP